MVVGVVVPLIGIALPPNAFHFCQCARTYKRILSPMFWSIRSRVWLYFAVVGIGTEKLLDKPGRLDAGKNCCNLVAIGEMRAAGMMLPAKGALFSGSLIMPLVM